MDPGAWHYIMEIAHHYKDQENKYWEKILLFRSKGKHCKVKCEKKMREYRVTQSDIYDSTYHSHTPVKCPHEQDLMREFELKVRNFWKEHLAETSNNL